MMLTNTAKFPIRVTMSYKSKRATCVLVHGAWHDTNTWNQVAPPMEAKQYRCVPVALPSAAADPPATFLADIEAVRDAIRAETVDGRDVGVVAHSFGGAFGSSAIKGLTQQTQDDSLSAKNPSGHVLEMIMLASGFVHTGVSFIDRLGGTPPPSWKADSQSGFAAIAVEPRQLFYHDLPTEEGNYWVGKLQKHTKSFDGGWTDVPVWYLATTEDQAFPVQTQRAFVQSAKDAGADVTLREVESSHSAMLNKPEETADFMIEAVASFMN